MNQIGQSIKKLSIFQNDHDDDDNDDNDDNDDDTHPPWIIVRVGMIFRRGQKCNHSGRNLSIIFLICIMKLSQ